MAITFFGDARKPATDNANDANTTATITPPANMAADDYVLVFINNDQISQTITNTVTGGQTWTAETKLEANSTTFQLWRCKFNGTWSADPAWSWTTSAPYIVWMVVFRGVDTTTPIDAALSQAGFAAPSSPFDVTIAASTITTVTDGAMVVACWETQDNNTWALQTAGWANPSSQAQWRNQGGTDASQSNAYKIQATAGGNEAVTNRQATLGGDAGIRAIIALRPAAVVETPFGPFHTAMALMGVGH